MNIAKGSVRLFLLALIGSASLVAASDEPAGDYMKAAEELTGKTMYLQHNLFYDDDDARWTNYREPGFLPPGTKVEIVKVKESKIVLTVDGREGKLKLDMDEPEPTYLTVAMRILGPEPPSMEGLSELDRKGIGYADLQVGMSRKAAFLAVGYPLYHHSPPFSGQDHYNRDLSADRLTFIKGSWDVMHVDFEDDKIAAIDD